MPKTGAIVINSKIDFLKYEEILNILKNNGWLLSRNKSMCFMVDGSFEWQEKSILEFDIIFDKIRASIKNNLETSIDLFYKDNNITVGLQFFDKKLMITITSEIIRLATLEVIDFSHYLNLISPILSILEYTSLECIYS